MACFDGLEQRDKTAILLSTVFLLLLGVLFFTNADPYFPCDNDLSHYIGAAKSLLKGNGYSFNGRPETLYPPGLSFSIAGIIYALGDEYINFSRYVAICSIISLIFTILYFKLRQIKYGIIYCIIIACSPTYFRYSTEVGSDVIFMMSSMGYIYFLELINIHKNDSHRKYILIPTGFFLLYAVASRSVGMALVAATGATVIRSLYINRKKFTFKSLDYSSVIFFAIGLGFYALWSCWSSANTIPLYDNEFRESYFRQFWLLNPHQPDRGNATLFFVFVRILNNIPVQIAHIAEFFTNIGWIKPLWLSPLTIFSALLFCIGLMNELRRSHSLAGWYALFYLAIILSWPFDEGVRFVFVVLPIIIILMIQGLQELVRSCQNKFDSINKYILYLSVFSLTGSIIHLIIAKVYSKQEIAFIVIWCIIILSLIFPYKEFKVFKNAIHVTSYASLFYMILFLTSSNFVIVPFITDRLSKTTKHPLESISLWIQKNTSSSSTIMSQSSAAIHYLTGRKTVPLPLTGNNNILLNTMNKLKPEYLVINKSKYQYVYYKPTEEERFHILTLGLPSGFKQVYEHQNIVIYHVQW